LGERLGAGLDGKDVGVGDAEAVFAGRAADGGGDWAIDIEQKVAERISSVGKRLRYMAGIEKLGCGLQESNVAAIMAALETDA
jgi:hypothetical protein